MPSSVHCIPLADWPGALKRISIEPAGRLGYWGFGAAGVFAWPAPSDSRPLRSGVEGPAAAGHGRVPTSTAPPAAACNHSLRLIIVIGVPSRVIAKRMPDEPKDQWIPLWPAAICWSAYPFVSRKL